MELSEGAVNLLRHIAADSPEWRALCETKVDTTLYDAREKQRALGEVQEWPSAS